MTRLMLLCFALLSLPLCSAAQNVTQYSNQYGQPVGSANTVGNTTYYSNQFGQPVGTAVTPQSLPAAPMPAAPPMPTMPSMPPMPLMPGLPALPGLK